MDPITPDEAIKRADELAEAIKRDNASIDKAAKSLDDQRTARGNRIAELRALADTKGLTTRQRHYINGALTESTPVHLRKKGGEK